MAFPTTSILDTFIRANERPLNPTNWFNWDDNDCEIVSNQCIATNPPGTDSWNNLVCTDSEVYATITVAPTSSEFIFLFARLDLVNTNGYTVSINNNQMFLSRWDNSSATILSTISQAYSSGDSIGLSVIGNTLTAYYKSGSGSWGSVGSTTDSTYSSGYLGIYLNTVSGSLNNFGGGSPVIIPTVSTNIVNTISLNSIYANGSIVATGGNLSTVQGFVYGTSSVSVTPTGSPSGSGYPGSVSTSGSFGAGNFSSNISGLNSAQIYYVRAFAQSSAGYGYGNEVAISTGQLVNIYNAKIYNAKIY